MCRPVHRRLLGVFVRGWDAGREWRRSQVIRCFPGREGEFLVKEETLFARRGCEVFEEEEKEKGEEGREKERGK